ncbi:MAG: S4 domain-containing protein, partial [Rhodospirillales bacterium]|nr:S4 domain-containing protein [Rhodospirillales bacterium]
MSGLSRSRLKKLIADGHVTCDENPVKDPAYKVTSGQDFRIIVPKPKEAAPRPQDIPLHIVYEDDQLIVVNKSPGLVVHPAPGNPDRTLVNALLAHCGDSLSGIGGIKRPGIVHRLEGGVHDQVFGVLLPELTEFGAADAHDGCLVLHVSHGI